MSTTAAGHLSSLKGRDSCEARRTYILAPHRMGGSGNASATRMAVCVVLRPAVRPG